MSNVVQLPILRRAARATDKTAALATCFHDLRHDPENVFWLKENAEFLNVLQTSGQTPDARVLDTYQSVYDGLWDRFAFFPQYYRFLLSICLDLEDLGMPGDTGARMAQTVARGAQVRGELSDLQRGEAARLLARRGEHVAGDPGLNDRLRGFCMNSGVFALPNKKAAYELTHIVFYLSEYGRRAPDLPTESETSLRYAGALAWLEGNSDLLAEVCIALRFGGWTPPAAWEDDVQAATRRFELTPADGWFTGDDYHAYLMGNWHGLLTGQDGFTGAVLEEPLRFSASPVPGCTALRELSQALYAMDGGRDGDWTRLAARLRNAMTVPAWSRLQELSGDWPGFDEFFRLFARETLADTSARAV